MSLAEKNKLRESLRRGKLTAADEQELDRWAVQDPEFHRACLEEAELNHLLQGLPEVPLGSNFTAQVLQVCETEARLQATVGWWKGSRLREWLPRLAIASLVLSLGLVSYQQHRSTTRLELAHGLAEISKLEDAPSVELLQNFEAIQRLNHVPVHVDRELIAALQ